MSSQTPDRRVRRTRHLLKEALLDLIDERDYESITIRDITDRADVGRSTFYSHFASKEDLLFSEFDRWLLSLPHSAPASQEGEPEREDSDSFRFSLPLLRHIRSQKRFFQATIARGSNLRIRRKVMALLVELVQLEMERIRQPARAAVNVTGRGAGEASADRPDPNDLRAVRAHAVVGAFLELVSWWLDDGEGLSAEDVDSVFQGLFSYRSTTL